MKQFIRSLLFLSIITGSAFSQKKLSVSRESGYYTYIYRMTDKEAFQVAAKTTSIINDSFLHTLVDSFYYAPNIRYSKKLGYGNYLYVTAIKNKLQYVVVPVSNVKLHFINNRKNFQLSITNLRGNPISDAEVRIGNGKKMSYHPDQGLYAAGKGGGPKVITVSYQGQYSFFTYEESQLYAYKKPSFLNSIFKPKVASAQGTSTGFKGYMVFNKPKYKPQDTVKFKAYMVTTSGKVIRDQLMRIELHEYFGYYDGRDDRDAVAVLDSIMPYRDGGYEYSFVITDSLDLMLDQAYDLVMKVHKGAQWKEALRGRFQHEDYELGALKFEVRTDREVHSPGNPATFFMKAKDENDLTVPDGRVEVFAFANQISSYDMDRVFIRDTLWKTEIKLDPVGETKLVLPDSIFPKAELQFSMRFTFLNSNNERLEQNKSLRFSRVDQQISTKLLKDSLRIESLRNGNSRNEKAMLYSRFMDGTADSAMLDLPVSVGIDYLVQDYEIRLLGNGLSKKVSQGDFSVDMDISATQQSDSLMVVVGNEHLIPFWYTIFSGNRLLSSGYSNRLDTVIRHHGTEAAHVRLNYIWGDREVSKEASAIFQEKRLNVKLLSPEVVYPGQTVNMHVKVTDAFHQPVQGTDVTAYAYTAKFEDAGIPALPYFGKRYLARKQKPEVQTESLSGGGEIHLQWDRWGKQLGLDTIAYYQFVNTPAIYVTNEASNDTTKSIVAPFVVLDGQIEPVHLVYIDGVPVYYSAAAQMKRYAFRVNPGKHRIELRTQGLLINAGTFDLAKGQKTIISINGRPDNEKVFIKKMSQTLSPEESRNLQAYMIRIHDNFDMEKTTLTTDDEKILVSGPSSRTQGQDLALGPFKENFMRFRSGTIDQTFIKESGYTYTFLPGLLKQKSFPADYAFNALFNTNGDFSNNDYRAEPLCSAEIDSLWEDYLNLRSRTTVLFNNERYSGANLSKLVIRLDSNMLKAMPYLKNILLYKNSQPDFLHIYPGNVKQYFLIEQGIYRILYLFKDNSYISVDDVIVLPYGTNYFEWKDLKVLPADLMSRKIDKEIKSVKSGGYGSEAINSVERISEQLNEKEYDQSMLTETMSGRILDSISKMPIPGVQVRIKGFSNGTFTDVGGYFNIKVPTRGILLFRFIGYDSREMRIRSGDIGSLLLNGSISSLDEVVVVGYGAQKKNTLTGAVSVVTESALMGRIAGVAVSRDKAKVMIRGMSTLPVAQKPLVFVDGLPFTGELSDLDADDVAEISTLKDAGAIAIYGARASNGVVIIKTKKGSAPLEVEGTAEEGGQSLRRNFSDYAIWQPKLFTDADGKATFKVKFPDDITSWSTKMIAMNGKRQAGFGTLGIRSFKMLSANFVSPQFAVTGDSIQLIGKLMNYSNADEQARRVFKYNDKEQLNGVLKFKNAHIDSMRIVANVPADSLSFEYTMKQDNGYFDGELRKIPLFKAGIQETKGYFNALMRDTTISYTFDPALGQVHLHAEASVFPTLLDEIDKLRRYEYLCNEQLASKLKALLLEKTVRKYLGNDFKEERLIQELIKKLQQNRRKEGAWGWWKDSKEEMWISLHVTEALLLADKQGYPITLNKLQFQAYLSAKLAEGPSFDQIYLVKLLRLLSDKNYIKDWVTAIERKKQEEVHDYLAAKKINPEVGPLADFSLYQKLQLMQLKQLAGIPVDIKWLLGLKKQTMFGNVYWGELNRNFWDNSIQNTLLSYQILKVAGGHQQVLEGIQRYFLEQRKDGQWRNTYESSLILETILPELMVDGQNKNPVSLQINSGDRVTTFPYQIKLTSAKLSVAKSGNAPVYFTAYQQYHNAKPEKTGKDFKVRSWFEQRGATVQHLKAGSTAVLNVEVEVLADADYVMVEVPIPAGCSYENKIQAFRGVETHREYFKHKTSIFCTKLKQGTYKFSIQLMPRYSGKYVLNPAKAEMMYFPVFYGREGLKMIGIN